MGRELKSSIDERSVGTVGFEECARKGMQVMDISFTHAMVVIKSGDQMSQGAVAQADVKQYYCHVAPLLLLQWLRAKGVPHVTCASSCAFSCVQACLF